MMLLSGAIRKETFELMPESTGIREWQTFHTMDIGINNYTVRKFLDCFGKNTVNIENKNSRIKNG